MSVLRLTLEGIKDAEGWRRAGVSLPRYDIAQMRRATLAAPRWIHFGIGNIFRIFIAALQEKLLNEGLCEHGIVAAAIHDNEIARRVYDPHDNLSLLVTLTADGGMQKDVVACIAQTLTASREFNVLRAYFENPALQMVSFTITEKGYATRPPSQSSGPGAPGACAMETVAALLHARWLAGAPPIAMVCMDNVSGNGDKLRASVLETAQAWKAAGLLGNAGASSASSAARNAANADGFLSYLSDPSRVSFPRTMIDKIVPRPSDAVARALAEAGIEGMEPFLTAGGTYAAAFVNAEAPQYLVIEDNFPAGRPPLERAGAFLTDRETVNRSERMKVTTCLNPLHTAMAVYGCLLGYTLIADEMADADIVRLIRRIGYDEGLPVAPDPGILNPRAFIDELLAERLPNKNMPDTPQRIATDVSQKIPIRYGETIKAYHASPTLSMETLIGVPLALAGWLRYLLGVDDRLAPMERSSDPLLDELTTQLASVRAGDPASLGEAAGTGGAGDVLQPILSNAAIFGMSLYEAGLAARVAQYLRAMLRGPGAVRETLQSTLPQ